jgi:hypothetical protein
MRAPISQHESGTRKSPLASIGVTIPFFKDEVYDMANSISN